MDEKLTIFYSWQSDLSKDLCQSAIRQSIRSAINKIEAEQSDQHLFLDEATRNKPGSPNIPQSIFEKISASDIFICDLTTINEDYDTGKKTPNPNVLIELGFAIAHLGWGRIIMVCNTNYGTFPNDLPFDIDRHRATPFMVSEKNDTNGKGDLTAKLREAIDAIVKESPSKASRKSNLSIKERKRERDVQNIEWIISCIHIPTFDIYIDDMPLNMVRDITFYYDWFSSIKLSSSFHIYDQKFNEIFQEFSSLWEKTMSFYRHYYLSDSKNYYRFDIQFDEFKNDQQENDYIDLSETILKLKSAFKRLLQFIRNNYIEINLDMTSRKAFDEHAKYSGE